MCHRTDPRSTQDGRRRLPETGSAPWARRRAVRVAVLSASVALAALAGGRQPAVAATSTPQQSDRFDLPAISAGPAVTLAEALRAAEARNPSLAVARSELCTARAQLERAWASNLPVLAGQVGYTHIDHEDTFNPAARLAPMLRDAGLAVPSSSALVVRPQEDFRAGLQLQFPVVQPQAWAAVGAARAGVSLVELTIEDARERLLLAVAQAYWVAVVNRELVAIRESQVNATADHHQLAQARVRAGDALRIDVVRAETDLERAGQDLIAAHLALDNARDALATLIGSEGLPMPAEPPTLPEPPTLDGPALAQALAERADMRASRAAIDLADQHIDVALMQLLPSVSVSGQAGYLFSTPPDLGSSDRSRWAAMITLSVPLYAHVRYADLQEKRAAHQQAVLRAEEVAAQAALEVRRTQRDYLSAMAASRTAARQAALTHEALDLTRSAYANGASTSLDVSDALRACRAGDLNAATQRLRAQLALLSLLQAVGADLTAL